MKKPENKLFNRDFSRRLLIAFVICSALGGSFVASYAAEKPLTKGEAIKLLSTTDFMKKKIGDLLSWTIGYDINRVNRVRLTPTITFVHASPKKIPPDGRTILEVTARVEDPGGQANISGVRADLQSIGRLPNMMLVDNGLWGDAQAGDGIYTLQSSVNPDIPIGDKEIQVAAANKKGWLALAKATVNIERNPVIIEAGFNPASVKRGGECTLIVKVENPGREEDITEIVANLAGVGLKDIHPTHKGGNLFSAKVVIPPNADPGLKRIPLKVVNVAGGITSALLELEIK